MTRHDSRPIYRLDTHRCRTFGERVSGALTFVRSICNDVSCQKQCDPVGRRFMLRIKEDETNIGVRTHAPSPLSENLLITDHSPNYWQTRHVQCIPCFRHLRFNRSPTVYWELVRSIIKVHSQRSCRWLSTFVNNSRSIWLSMSVDCRSSPKIFIALFDSWNVDINSFRMHRPLHSTLLLNWLPPLKSHACVSNQQLVDRCKAVRLTVRSSLSPHHAWFRCKHLSVDLRTAMLHILIFTLSQTASVTTFPQTHFVVSLSRKRYKLHRISFARWSTIFEKGKRWCSLWQQLIVQLIAART